MSVPGSHPGPRYQPLLQLLRTADALWQVSRLFFARWELSPSQFNILNLLSHATDGLSQVDLSRELIMHRSNVTGLIDRLEKRRLVTRKPHPDDRRAWRVLITKSGQALLQDILPEYYRLAEEVWGETPPEAAQALAGQLEFLNSRVNHINQMLS